MGAYIIIGHALIEIGIVVFLLLGFSFVLQNRIVVRSIGIIGGMLLFYLGFSIIRDVKQGKIHLHFPDKTEPKKMTSEIEENNLSRPGQSLRDHSKETMKLGHWLIENPVIGGMIVSMSNPYWWVWWATIGFAFMVQFDVSLNQWPKLFAFFFGHEAGDLTWYVIVSFLSFYGIRRLNKKAYQVILIICGIFMMGFGAYMAVMPFIKQG